MARGWRVLDATSLDGALGGSRGTLTFSPADGPNQTVPAVEVAVILFGSNTHLSASAIHYISKYDIAALACDWRGVPYAGLFHWGDHGRVAARHIAQAQLTVPRRKNAWMQVIRSKIRGQSKVLEDVNQKAAARLQEYVGMVRSGDPVNVEARAARVYWARMFPGQTFNRDPGGEDRTNSLLNYGYTVLRGYGIRAVLAAGLSPPLGIFHRGRGNYFNLVDDLIEPFRPAIDHSASQLGGRASLDDPGVRAALVGAAAQPFLADGTRIPTVLEDLAQQFGRYVEGDLNGLRVPYWRGPVSPPRGQAPGNEE